MVTRRLLSAAVDKEHKKPSYGRDLNRYSRSAFAAKVPGDWSILSRGYSFRKRFMNAGINKRLFA